MMDVFYLHIENMRMDMIAQFHLAKDYQVGYYVQRARHFPNTERSFKFRPLGCVFG